MFTAAIDRYFGYDLGKLGYGRWISRFGRRAITGRAVVTIATKHAYTGDEHKHFALWEKAFHHYELPAQSWAPK